MSIATLKALQVICFIIVMSVAIFCYVTDVPVQAKVFSAFWAGQSLVWMINTLILKKPEYAEREELVNKVNKEEK